MKNILKNANNYTIKYLTAIIIIGQMIAFIAIQSKLLQYSDLYINYTFIRSGEIWRIFSFIFIPPRTNIIFAIFSWYILYLMGSNLEQYWGHLHYNLYILLAIVLTNIASLLFNFYIGTNYYLQSSIFLAFAFLNPNFQVRLFFILPIKIKWIAILTWVLYLYTLIFGNLGEKLLLIASVMNFGVFFSKDIYFKLKYRGKNIKSGIEKKITENKPNHVCLTCSRNDIDFPYLEFRYCSKCNPVQCYCEEHINNHTHKE